MIQLHNKIISFVAFLLNNSQKTIYYLKNNYRSLCPHRQFYCPCPHRQYWATPLTSKANLKFQGYSDVEHLDEQLLHSYLQSYNVEYY
jgi:hypothetical protein